MKEIFIHFGAPKFDKSRFTPISNNELSDKPIGGLWASPTIDIDLSWHDWCLIENFKECNYDNSFKFKLKDDARVLLLINESDLSKVPAVEGGTYKSFLSTVDFEKLSQDYDAILAYMYRGDNHNESLRWHFLDWDVDSLLVLNPDVIEEI